MAKTSTHEELCAARLKHKEGLIEVVYVSHAPHDDMDEKHLEEGVEILTDLWVCLPHEAEITYQGERLAVFYDKVTYKIMWEELNRDEHTYRPANSEIMQRLAEPQTTFKGQPFDSDRDYVYGEVVLAAQGAMDLWPALKFPVQTTDNRLWLEFLEVGCLADKKSNHRVLQRLVLKNGILHHCLVCEDPDDLPVLEDTFTGGWTPSLDEHLWNGSSS